MGKKKKHGLSHRLRQLTESLSLRLFFNLLGHLPPAWRSPLARFLAGFYIRFFPLRRGVLAENLETAFGPDPSPERASLIRGIYVSSIQLALELARLRYASFDEVQAAVLAPVDGQGHFDALRAAGKGILIASGHMGNWEWMGAWFAQTYGHFGVVYKPMHNPDSDAVARALRERFGIQILSTRARVPREIFKLIREGGNVAILADQDARNEGRFVPFFGKPASTATGLASLALRLEVPILPAFCLRQPDGRFRVKVYPPLWPDLTAPDRAAEELRLTAAYIACVEDIARKVPEQYFWWHRRWKTQPKD